MIAGPASSPPPTPSHRLARFPWLRLLSLASVGLSARMLVLGAVGVLLLRVGWLGLDRAFGDGLHFHWLLDWDRHQPPSPLAPDCIAKAASLASAPVRAPLGPIAHLLSIQATWGGRAHALLATIWSVIVLGLIGGAMARIAVVRAATGGRIGIRTALGFAAKHAIALVATPLLPFFVVGFFALGCAGLGLLYRLGAGGWGESIASAFLPLPLLAGLAMAILLIGLAACWPLMISTVAAEGEDTFEALSRSYNYVLYRPLAFAALVALAWAIATLALLVVGLFSQSAIHLGHWGLSLGAGPDLGRRLSDLSLGLETVPPDRVHRGWLSLARLVAYAAAWGLFWAAAAFIYLAMRLIVDGARWHEIHQPRQATDAQAPAVQGAGTDNAPESPATAGPGPESPAP